MVKLSKEERDRRIAKYHRLIVRQCPKCGKPGILDFRHRGGSGTPRYFYCRHGNEACYVGTIEKIAEIMGDAAEAKDKERQTRLYY